MADALPRLYTELASWYPLLSAPEDYVEEEAVYRQAILAASATPPKTLLELGSGSGAIASHYKRYFQCTLTDPASEMLDLSRAVNPECEHIVGDMRDLRLGRLYDAVFVHDAVCYMTSEVDLRRAIETAYVHCRPGGVALFVPDAVKETFHSATDSGGRGGDGDGRALRYLMWTHDADPSDDTYEVDFVYLLQEGDAEPDVVHERHIEGLFSEATWLRMLVDAGFDARMERQDVAVDPEGTQVLFIAVRPAV